MSQPAGTDGPADLPIANEADVAEQALEADRIPDADAASSASVPPPEGAARWDADEADVLEQTQPVPGSEDDYPDDES